MVVSWQQTKGGEKRILDSGLASKVPELCLGNTDSLILLIEETGIFVSWKNVCGTCSLRQKLSGSSVLVKDDSTRHEQGDQKNFRSERGKRGGSSTRKFIWGHCFDRFACRKSLRAGDLPEAVGLGASKKRGRDKERLGERRRRERKFTCWGDVSLVRLRTLCQRLRGAGVTRDLCLICGAEVGPVSWYMQSRQALTS